jgi:hypothetical protein
MVFYKKLTHPHILRRIFYERLTEPIHLNALAVLVGLFGTFRQKVPYDLVLRPYHAYSVLRTADWAKAYGLKSVNIIEFGVAAGSGLMNIALLAQKVSAITGVDRFPRFPPRFMAQAHILPARHGSSD